jgi:O-antigen/teichoic acid export membrane protein
MNARAWRCFSIPSSSLPGEPDACVSAPRQYWRYCVTNVNPFRIFKNAGANVARGMAAALVALVLPSLLTRSMSPDAYGAWVLILQFSAYIAYLDFGIQTAIGRFVAYANERFDREYRDRIVSTSLAALGVAALLGLLAAVVAAVLLPHLFRQMPADLLGRARIALLLVAGSLAVGLPFSAFNGVFVGLHRYDIPAITVGGSRILGGALLVLVVRYGGGLVWMGIAAMTVNLLAYAVQYIVYRSLAPDMSLGPTLVTRAAFRELFDYCFSLSIWSFTSLLVAGVDLVLVGFFQYQEVAFYAVAATLVTFLAGLQSAIFNALLPSAAALHARGSSDGLGRMLITSTRYGAFLLLLTGIPLLLWAPHILRIWVGPLYAAHGAVYLRILVIANMIRLSATPYSVLLIGTAQQKLAMVSPVAEGVTNLVASLIGGYWFGAKGIAAGTLIGSVIGILIHFARNLKRTTEIHISMKEFLCDGLIGPAVWSVPILAGAAWLPVALHSRLPSVVLFVSFSLTLLLAWKWGTRESEREWLKAHLLRPGRQ